MTDVELPSIEEIEEMDRLRQQAIEALEISVSASGQYVKCQKCNIAVPSDGRITTLQEGLDGLKKEKAAVVGWTGTKN